MRKAIIVLVFCAAASAAFAVPVVSLTGAIAANFDAVPSVQQAIETFQANQPLWGFGWEVVPRRMGIGGLVMVNFFRDAQSAWVLDWSAQPVYLSYHIFGGGAFLDPFIQAGIGCTGRVPLEGAAVGMPSLYLSLFPFLAAGLSLNLEGFLLGAKLAYAPFSAPVPVTDIPAYPTGSIQVTVFTGISF
jgi:hypothetical protein